MFGNRSDRNLLASEETKSRGSLNSLMRYLVLRKHFAMLSNALLAKWQFHEQKAVIRWFARTVDSTSAITVARQLMDMTILGKSF